ncbi:late embryogenesis abundant protein Lea5-like [Ananas comosus]|uniref:Late embryogenesis abundant protein Lea5-like n=1 Tax=Ananas comosus TaxID=4615 RepID=A0A6P5GIP2_ANACO|nr:late embryogenesis abundant protein Lea5-like [Ananas comosus]
MARALFNPRLVVASLAEGAALVSRRYAAAAAAAEAGVKVRAAEDKAVAVVIGRKAESAAAEAAWVPDPVTGYYRPGNRAVAVDAAEMREMFLPRRARE